MYAYVGSRTTRERNARGEGITVFRVGPGPGRLEPVQVLACTNPSFLALNRRGDRLYAVHGDQREASTFTVDSDSGRIALLHTQTCDGLNPVHLALDPTERFLVVSNYLSGKVAVLPVRDDGMLAPPAQQIELPGTPGPHRSEQSHAKPHFNGFDPTGRYVVVPDKGLDTVFLFRFDNGTLQPAATPAVAARQASGPRHAAFHPSEPYVFVLNELDCTVVSYRFDAQAGTLEPLYAVASLPETYTGDGRGAEIAVHPSGRHLYVSNRGSDTLTVYDIVPGQGRPVLKQTIGSGGRMPRFFTLSPDGRCLYALNESSDTIVAFDVDPHTGRLTQAVDAPTACASPVCMIFPLAASRADPS